MKSIAIAIAFVLPFSNLANLMDDNNANFPYAMENTENISKAIVYILPYEKCSDYWASVYVDRIYYYVYGNVTEDRTAIKKILK